MNDPRYEYRVISPDEPDYDEAADEIDRRRLAELFRPGDGADAGEET